MTTPRRGGRGASVPRQVRLMRTIAVVLAVVGGVLVVGDLRSRAGLDVALGPQPPATPCQPGSPTRMSIPAIGVDAPVETIGLDRGGRRDEAGRAPLAAPVDQRKIGWYAEGPSPGSGTGTVLTNGHTYRDGSAVFQQDFPTRIAVGQEIDLIVDNGSTCRYRISTVWRDVDAATGYPQLVADQQLYARTGPERLFLETCSGPWLASERRFEDITVVLATPVST